MENKSFPIDGENFVELENHPGYFVSNMGRFRRGNTKILSTPANTKGYAVFSVMQDKKRKFYLAHRLIALHFIGRLDGKEVNHKNFNKSDNRVENLEIVTRLENMRHYHRAERAKDVYTKISITKTGQNRDTISSISKTQAMALIALEKGEGLTKDIANMVYGQANNEQKIKVYTCLLRLEKRGIVERAKKPFWNLKKVEK